jgi:hypothetical protein
MATAKAVGAMSTAAEATVTMLMTGGVTISKSVGRSRSGLEEEIRADRAARPDLDQDDVVRMDLGRAELIGP